MDTRREIVFIDTALTDWETLLASISGTLDVVLLNPQQNGLEQIATYLSAQPRQTSAIPKGSLQNVLQTDAITETANLYDAIHIFSHGSAGHLYLGSTDLNSNNLNDYQSQLQQIGSALTDTGDLLLYGCNVAEGDVGNQFITALAEVTGADVVASNNLTGSILLGGDWALETKTGTIETSAIAPSSDYNQILAINNITGSTSSETIYGTSGDDNIDGGGGNDVIDGGAGTDTLLIFDNRDNFYISTLEGETRLVGLYGANSRYYGDEVFITNIETIQFQDTTVSLAPITKNLIVKTGSSETILGTDGNDAIDSRGGNDVIDGGAGTDTLMIFDNRDNFYISTLEGETRLVGLGSATTRYDYDEVFITNIETIQFQDTTVSLAPITKNLIVKTGSSETILGTDGNDAIDSRGGNDVIDGGTGTDTLLIFDNRDNFYISTLEGETRLVGLYGANSRYYGDEVFITNIETIQFQDTTVSLAPITKNLIVKTGSSETILGTDGNDAIDSRGGNDVIDGGAGTDTVIFFDNRSNFSVNTSNGITRVKGLGSATSRYDYDEVVMANVEYLQFADDVVSIISDKNGLLFFTNEGVDGYTTIYRYGLNGFEHTQLESVFIADSNSGIGGAAGIYSGFDLDFVFLDMDGDYSTDNDRIFGTDFNFNLGSIRPTTDPILLPTQSYPGPTIGSLSANTIDTERATLNTRDAPSATVLGADGEYGALTLGDGGSLEIIFATPITLTGSEALFFGEVSGSNGEKLNVSIALTGSNTSANDDYADDASDTSAPIGILSIGSSINGFIGPADSDDTYGDKDVFKVSLTQGQSYKIQMQSIEVNGQTLPQSIFTVRDPNNFDTVLSTSAIGAEVAVNFTANSTGEYYIRVGTGGAATDEGGYQLSVNNQDPPIKLLPDFLHLEFFARQVAYGYESLLKTEEQVLPNGHFAAGWTLDKIFEADGGLFRAVALTKPGFYPVLAI